jgi:hypothetical protein
MLAHDPARCLPRRGGGFSAWAGDDEKMQEFPENPRPTAGPQTREQAPGPRTPAQQAAGGALAAADLAIGIGGGAVGFARSVFRAGQPLLDLLMAPLTSATRAAAPLASLTGAAAPQARLRQAVARGRQDREALTAAVVRLILTRVPSLTTALLNQLDLTAVVGERVDVNAVAEHIDVDAIAQRVDVIAILDRVDPVAVTRYLIEELDLPQIIQSSTGSIMSDTVQDVRMQSISADERLSRAVDAMLLRRRSRRKAAPGAAGPAAAADTAGAAGTTETTGPATATGNGDGAIQATT